MLPHQADQLALPTVAEASLLVSSKEPVDPGFECVDRGLNSGGLPVECIIPLVRIAVEQLRVPKDNPEPMEPFCWIPDRQGTKFPLDLLAVSV